MKIKNITEPQKFFEVLNECKGRVELVTSEGDRLNMKSTLCQYIALTQMFKEATIYVSLEPCSHYGKTPPCADLIIEKKIPKVVIGCMDPFSMVAGRGIEKLRNAGIKVTVGVLEEECRQLIRRFITFNTQKRPFITLKWAESADGFIDKNRTGGSPIFLSTPLTSMVVHKRRAESIS